MTIDKLTYIHPKKHFILYFRPHFLRENIPENGWYRKEWTLRHHF